MLGGLGFELSSGGQEGNEGYMDEGDVVAPQIGAHLSGGLEEGLGLDVTDGATDLGDDDVGEVAVVIGLGLSAHDSLDLVGDVRDDLDSVAEVLPSPFLCDDGGVDLSGGGVGLAGEVHVEKSLVVPDVEIGLRAVVSDEDLAVLEGVHRAGIDVDVGVQLLHDNADAAGP